MIQLMEPETKHETTVRKLIHALAGAGISLHLDTPIVIEKGVLGTIHINAYPDEEAK